MNETYVTLVGTVASDPTQRRTRSNVLVCSFRVASNERRYDRERNEWVNGDPVFASVSCWRRMASGAASSLRKGDPVFVVGRLRVRQYEHNNERRQSVEISADAVGPDLSRCTAVITKNSARPNLEVVVEPDIARDRDEGADLRLVV
jgi:single-strand DNA-binding protein